MTKFWNPQSIEDSGNGMREIAEQWAETLASSINCSLGTLGAHRVLYCARNESGNFVLFSEIRGLIGHLHTPPSDVLMTVTENDMVLSMSDVGEESLSLRDVATRLVYVEKCVTEHVRNRMVKD